MENKVKMKVKTICKKYPSGVTSKEIDNGAEPYEVSEKEVIIDANDRCGA